MPNDGLIMESDAMHTREVTLPDGRYMIFYTFGEEVAVDPASQHEVLAEERTAPAAEPSATPPL